MPVVLPLLSPSAAVGQQAPGSWTRVRRRATWPFMPFVQRFLLAIACVALATCAPVSPAASVLTPVETQPFLIAANPLAARAGMEVLERGGSAVDAAVAIQAMLSLVEPQSSGIGGGAFMTYYD